MSQCILVIASDPAATGDAAISPPPYPPPSKGREGIGGIALVVSLLRNDLATQSFKRGEEWAPV